MLYSFTQAVADESSDCRHARTWVGRSPALSGLSCEHSSRSHLIRGNNILERGRPLFLLAVRLPLLLSASRSINLCTLFRSLRTRGGFFCHKSVEEDQVSSSFLRGGSLHNEEESAFTYRAVGSASGWNSSREPHLTFLFIFFLTFRNVY